MATLPFSGRARFAAVATAETPQMQVVAAVADRAEAWPAEAEPTCVAVGYEVVDGVRTKGFVIRAAPSEGLPVMVEQEIDPQKAHDMYEEFKKEADDCVLKRPVAAGQAARVQKRPCAAGRARVMKRPCAAGPDG